MTLPFAVSVTQCCPPLDAERLQEAVTEAAAAVATLRQWQADGSLPLLGLPERRDDLDAVRPVAQQLIQSCEVVLLLGTGGSSLGAKTLNALSDVGFGPPPGLPKLVVMENIDPHTFVATTQAIQGRRVGVLAVSKSGSTAETLSTLLSLLPALPAGSPFVAITEPGDNPLRRLTVAHGGTVLDHDPKVGGRYSVLSIVGLLPALLAGLDASAVRAGAAEVLEATLAGTGPAVGGAGLAVAAMRAGLPITVLMPYVDRLAEFGLWYRQLWAESLGKDGHGTTPIRAMGTVDQHSQLQLYRAGPADKLYTIIAGPARGLGPKLAAPADGRLGYLTARCIGDLLDAETRATIETLVSAGRPVRTITLPTVDERTLGGLFMMFMLETILAALVIGVDPFDQPAVEDGKVLARRYLAEMAG
ncbi:MAG: glucose-6-phosphate isomerase [Alphaproteobacteria bacterium]|nr:glucose-6-phosphate isomerase [Alphaproteobacteria bacterium]